MTIFVRENIGITALEVDLYHVRYQEPTYAEFRTVTGKTGIIESIEKKEKNKFSALCKPLHDLNREVRFNIIEGNIIWDED